MAGGNPGGEGGATGEVFQAVSVEVAQPVPAEGAALTRCETDGTVTALGAWTSSGGYLHAGTGFALEGTVSGLVFETSQPARMDSYADAPGPLLVIAGGWDHPDAWRSPTPLPSSRTPKGVTELVELKGHGHGHGLVIDHGGPEVAVPPWPWSNASPPTTCLAVRWGIASPPPGWNWTRRLTCSLRSG